ncbi:MAG: HAMP domain-containing histidine kinase [Acidimicrobiia bacterium]|nr:HAMP domain-containing histidine kinase [Acidimicrobiia bacterium]
MSIRTRLLLIVSGLFAVGLAVTALATITAVRRDMIARLDDTLLSASRNPPPGGRVPPPGQIPGLPQVSPVPVEGDVRRSLAVTVYDESGRLVEVFPSGFGAEQDRPPDLPASTSGVPLGSVFEVTAQGDSDLTYRAYATRQRDGRVVVYASPLTDVQATVRGLAVVWSITGAVVLAVLVGVGWWAIRAGMRPVDSMIDTAGAIAGGDLTQRVDHTDPRTEVGRLGAALNTMLSRIEAAFAAQVESEDRLRQFVADASHELRTPLTAIRGYAELYEAGALHEDGKVGDAMGRIGSESRRMGGLVEDLLLLARLDQGRPLQAERVDLAEVCADAVRDSEATDATRPVSLLADGPAVVRGDPERLHQVVANLLANTRTHTPEGTAVEVYVDADADNAAVSVSDTGPGLDAAHAEHVFDRFWRAEPGRARAGSGSGLGLSIVQSIVAAHGGDVAVETEPGLGFRVTLRIPLAP